MNAKRITYLAAAMAVTAAATSCEHEEIYAPLEFSVRLAPTNTYMAGDPVVFDIGGNADFITVWTGDTGHEYKHRERTAVGLEDIESCELEIELYQRYGDAKPEVTNLELLVSNQLPAPLAGDDAAADRPIVEGVAADDGTAWHALDYPPHRNGEWETLHYDITPYADNFSWAIHLSHEPGKAMRTYWFNPRITVKFKGYETKVYTYPDMDFVPFSVAPQHAENPYVCNVAGNGNLKFQGRAGSSSAANIVFQGFNAGAMDPIDQWAFMQPLPLNTISPDTGQNIKGVTDDVRSFEYVYTEPGTYTTTFVVANGNYQGESGTHLYEVTFTVIDPIR